MGTYFHGSSEIQGSNGDGGLQTLILMNPAYGGYSENQSQQQTANNFVFLNSNSAGNLPHAPPSQPQHFVGIPLQQNASTQEQDHGFIPRVQYNLYNQQMELAAARDFTRAQQGLSLSLSSQQPGYVSFNNREIIQSHPMVTAMSSPRSRLEDVRGSGGSPSSASGVSNGVNGGVQSVLLSSKYLKAAQEILDEVVNVGKGRKSGCESSKSDAKNTEESEVGGGGDMAEGSEKRAAELSTAERQEIQMKKAKLVNMLDEVEQRYRQYHHQMQIVISWFEQAAGIGAAKTYTALALQTISKQFRCLKDAILGQIRSASKSLGEEESFGGKIEGSRLKYVDNQIRQQRALQQLGMIQHNAWRPQRGLPERSVSVLRAWLFEHFLHPYPKDSDKIVLAKQTGLTRSQVSNWFINARVRLWKPMVEEMYNEEIKEHERNESEDKNSTKTTQNEDSTSKTTAPPKGNSSVIENQNNNFIPKQDNINNPMNNQNIPTNSTSPTIRSVSGFNLIRPSEMENITQQSPKKPRNVEYLLHSPNGMQAMNMDLKPNNSENVNMLKFGNDRESRDGFSLMGAPTNFIGGFTSYPIAELGRFGADQFQAPYSGNGVSLTLGLPHCENLSLSGPHQNFMPGQLGRGVEMGDANDFNGMNTPTSAHSNNVFENINLQNRKRFAAQLLPDFVA